MSIKFFLKSKICLFCGAMKLRESTQTKWRRHNY